MKDVKNFLRNMSTENIGWILFIGGILVLSFMFPVLWILAIIIFGYKLIKQGKRSGKHRHQ